MKIPMRCSRKGAKDNTIRLVCSKYFKYVIDGKGYFLKEKSYATHHDGWIDTATIKEQTYKNAVKRGNECIEINTEEGILASSKEHSMKENLAIIFGERYDVPSYDARKCIDKANIVIEQIQKNTTMSAAVEYQVFRGILESHINSIKKEIGR